MANSSSKGLTIGIIALVLIVALVFVISRHNDTTQTSVEVSNTTTTSTAAADTNTIAETKPAAETPADTAKTDETKAEPAKTDDKNADAGNVAPVPAASATADTDLTAPEGELTVTNKQTTEAAKIEETSKTDDAAKDEKKDDKNTSNASSSSSVTDNGSLLASPAALDVDVDKAMADRSLGRDGAPVTMIEYASLTCPHCAHFSNDLLPEVKAKLIDTGKLRVIYRDYPLDTYAMKAAMMARCAEPDKYFDLIEVIFKNQEHWVRNPDPVKGLVQLGALAGMSPDYIKSCMANEELQSAILNRVQEAQKNYKLNATPTFIFNNGAEVMSGDKEVEDFVNVVNKLTGK